MWFTEDLAEAASTGLCTLRLYTHIATIRIMLAGDVQENEGVNSLITRMVERSPHIGLPLLCARVRIKKALGVGSAGAPKTWASRRPAALKILRAALQHERAGRPILHELDDEADRYTTPHPALLPALPKQTSATNSDKWVAMSALVFHKAYKSLCAGDDGEVVWLIGFDSLVTGSVCYICAERVRASYTVAELTVVSIGADASAELDIVIPLRFARHLTAAC